MAKSYFKNHPVQSGVAVGVILLFISSTGITAWLQNIAWWTATKNVISTIWNAIVWIMTINIPIWGILASIAGLIMILYISNLIYNATHKTSGSNNDEITDWQNYKSDTFGQFKYDWEYRINGRTYSVFNLKVLCPHCETPLMSDGFYDDHYKCPRCNRYFNNIHNTTPKPYDEVTALIYDNIKRNRY